MEIISIKKIYNRKWTIGNILIGSFLFLPIGVLFYNLFNSKGKSFKYLFENLLFDYSLNTIYLILITCLCSLIFAILPAWFISNYKFKGRKIYDVLLFLPLSIPSYIMAFTYSEILSFTGPIQTFFKNFSPEIADFLNKDYLQIEVLGIILALALYPYVYTSSRISFSYIGSNYINLSKTLGLSSIKTFYKVIIPLSKPAIFSGLFLIILEVLNEYGAVKYFGVNTYTTGIFRAWFSMGETNTAIQLACLLLIIVFLIFVFEKKSNSNKGFYYSSNSKIQKLNIVVKKNLPIIHFSCLIPFLFGFFFPFIFILNNSFKIISSIEYKELIVLLVNSLSVSSISSLLIVLFGVILIFIEKNSKSKINVLITQLVSLGYAIPGAVIGLSLILLFTSLKNSFFPISIIGSIYILIYAYIVRFLAVGISPIRSSVEKMPESYNDTGKNLGLGFYNLLKKIHLPINKLAIISAFIITFVDLLKELPITLILRPFNFDTLATQTYQFAIEEMLKESSIYSLFIITIGCVMLLIFKAILNKELDVS